MLRPRLTRPDWDRIGSGLEDEVAGFLTEAMRDTADEVKDAFRAQVRAAGLGDKLANAVRGVTYPNRNGRHSLEPTGWIYAQPSRDGRGAAAIIESYASGASIVPRAGKRWLAVPTDDVPRKRQGNAMTPDEVEQRFGRRLVFIDPADKGFRTPSVRRAGVAYLVMKGLVVRKATGRWRQATDRERAGKTRNPRPLQNVIMFTLVRQVKKPKSVDLSAPAALAEARFDANLSARWR
ncbi:hypothetical protein SAMN05192583_0886 [Sphingomonas gellani]|uniref:Uncharacterized protein n=1 Tax=Sphingomonas gellani TaxID=1166340 RepID=A0A1H7ZZN4_9SPHN|nr:DUF6441 family protein [Sphingomonas gellani]SEM62777.1 hypothetical protein SAMN05192583_0886 [Sphingomonas gellani]